MNLESVSCYDLVRIIHLGNKNEYLKNILKR